MDKGQKFYEARIAGTGLAPHRFHRWANLPASIKKMWAEKEAKAMKPKPKEEGAKKAAPKKKAAAKKKATKKK